MKFVTAVLFAGIASAAAWQPPQNVTSWGAVYTTEVVTAFTTYCPEATTFSHAGVTYTVTEATTLTITNCPCTITKPASSTPAAPVVTSTTPCTTTTTPFYPPPPPPSPVYGNSTTVVTNVKPTGSGVATGAQFTGAANHLSAAGVGMAAVAGLVAALF